MRQKVSLLLIILGIVLLLGAAGLLLHNDQEAEEAASFAAQILPELSAEASRAAETAVEEGYMGSVGETLPVRDPKDFSRPWPTAEIGGRDYMGILSIPAIDYVTPVLADCSEDLLRLGACRFHGSLYGGPLVICAHNYQRLYSRLTDLRAGDSVLFQDMYGYTWSFQVADLETLEANMVTEMNSSDYPLTFFTCTYGGEARLTLRCVKP